MAAVAIILSGGYGSRLNFVEKGLLAFNGQTLIANKIKQLQERFEQIVVVVNRPELYQAYVDQVIITTDHNPYSGPWPALLSGMQAVKADSYFLCAVDMPHCNLELIDYFASFTISYTAVVGRLNNIIEPLFGFYSREFLSLQVSADAGLKDLLLRVNTKYILGKAIQKFDPEYQTYTNLNTQKDWEKLADVNCQTSPRSYCSQI